MAAASAEREAPRQDVEAALLLQQQAAELAASKAPLDARRESADALYARIVPALQKIRGRLGAALDAGGATAQRKALYDAMIGLNRARLDTIDQLSPGARRRVLGFGSEGAAQVGRELSQISLDARYNIQAYGARAPGMFAALLHPTPAVILTLFELLLVAMLFRAWRRHGGGLLERAEARVRDQRPPTLWSNARARLLVCLQRVRGPLDWLILIQIIRWLLPDPRLFPGLELFWILLTWALIAAAVIRLVDSIARGDRRDDPRARLRWKSLSLVGGTIVAVGMVLRIADTLVGKGAIYSWVLSACWMLAPPIVLLLAHWWRERIVVLSTDGADKSAILAWTARDPDGIGGLVGRVLAGAILILKGFRRLLVRQAKTVALVREIYGQRARKQAAEQVAQDRASGIYCALDDAVLAPLLPHRLPPEGEGGGGPAVAALSPAGTITAIVGYRGLGKSAALQTLLERAGDPAARVRVAVGTGGLPALLADIAVALGAEAGGEADADMVLALVAQRPDIADIAVDDVQRLLVPAISGLADFDALVALARAAPPRLRWTMTIGGPAWSYLRRARHDRLVFDAVVQLPRWTVKQLRDLIEVRTHEAGLDPDFGQLIGDVPLNFDSEVTPEELNQRGYFELLADFTAGNPAVALEFWRRSLFRHKDTGQIVVRTFETPDISRVASLPQASLFVLRTIVQMDRATTRHIEISTDLAPIIVADALRGLERIGVIVPFEGGYRVALFWWAEAVRLLERRNLIVPEMVP